jgi:uncharacterized membrane protein YtjA (UPF0391 family)
MFNNVLTFLLVALVATACVIAGSAIAIAKLLFAVFLVLFVASQLFHSKGHV